MSASNSGMYLYAHQAIKWLLCLDRLGLRRTALRMRLLSHNVLRNNAKGVVNGFPLQLEATKVEVKESEFDPDFIKNLLHTVSLDGLRVAASNLGLDVSSIPTEITPELREDETFLKAMHGLLMDVHVMEGALICPETQRRFPIQNGIPNMMLTDEELP